jgi:hypothetical protein
MSAMMKMPQSTVTPSGEVTMSSLELVEYINSQRGPDEAELRHNNFMAKVPKVLGADAAKFLATQKYGNGNSRDIYNFPKREACLMAMSYSYELQAIVFDRMTAQEQQAQMERRPSGSKLIGELAIMECYAKLQRVSPSSQVAMLAKIANQNGLDATFLPSYVVDAPDDASPGSSLPTASLTELLKANGISINASAYNVLLRKAGLLAQCERRSKAKDAKNGKKRYWCITKLGSNYGKNLTNPASPRETQPHWYVDRFAELHRTVSASALGAEV